MAYTILVIGKAGNGKSAICNTILGEEKCALGRSLSTATHKAQKEDVVIGNCEITVVDTPDVTNCGLNPEEQIDEVKKWKRMTSGCPSAVLLAVRCDVRYTTEDYQVFLDILKLWGDKSLKKRLLVAFTFEDPQDDLFKTIIKKPPPELRKVLRVAGQRYFVFNNKANADRNGQARDLVSLIQDMDHSSCHGCF